MCGGDSCILSSKSTLVAIAYVHACMYSVNSNEECFSFIQFQVHSQQVDNNLLCEVPGDSPNSRRTLESNCKECYPGLDLSTDCSTCEGESIQCVEGEQNCRVNLVSLYTTILIIIFFGINLL